MTTAIYATEQDFRSYIKDDTSLDAAMIGACLLSASRSVEGFCGRHFYQHVDTQYFSPDENNWWILPLDDMDLATTDGLTVTSEYGSAGNYPTAWTLDTDFICEPVNQSMNGIEGWPFTHLRALGGKIWPPRAADFWRDTVKVVGTWGWPTVPDAVKQATLILAVDLYKLSDAPFGVAGYGAYGAVRVRDNPKAAVLLQPYRKGPSLLFA